MTTQSANERRTYVVLKEVSDMGDSLMYNFLRLEGNETQLKSIKEAIDKVEEWNFDHADCEFEIDIEHPVSEQTAQEFCKLTVNEYFSRKFDGKMSDINFKFSSTDKA